MAESSASQNPSQNTSSIPTIDEFAETLQKEERWYQLGIFMGAPIGELNSIHDMKSQATCDILMLLIQLYDCLEKKRRPLTWEAIATALRRLGNHALAEEIHSRHHNKSTPPAIVPQGDVSTNPNPTQHTVTNSSSDTTVQTHTITSSTIGTTSTTSHTTVGTNDSSNDAGAVIVKHEHCPIFNEYHSLDETFNELLIKAKDVFMSERIRLDVAQDVLRRRCGLPPLTQEKATPSAVFTRVEEQCSIINFRILVFLVKSLELGETLLEQLETLKGAVDRFKSSANMVELVDLIKSNQTMPTGEQKAVKLKVREFWSKFTMEQFEVIINEIFLTLYDIMTCVTVTKGCICLNWIIPDIDTTKLLPVLPLELVRLIGVIYLHIGSDVIYNIEGEGCESIEAAMIQAIELKNTRAIELLLAVGCNPEVATYNGDNTMTNIVNIKQPLDETSSSSSTVPQYVCVLGHNEHVEAIIDPDSVLPSSANTEQCDLCRIKDKILKQTYQEMHYYRLKARKDDTQHSGDIEGKATVSQDKVGILNDEKQEVLRELAAAKGDVDSLLLKMHNKGSGVSNFDELVSYLKGLELFDALVQIGYKEDVKITKQPVSMRVMSGEKLRLECKAEGVPRPQYMWFQGQKPLGQKNSILEIDKVTPDHAGLYTCRVGNTANIVFSQWVEIEVQNPINIDFTIMSSSPEASVVIGNESFSIFEIPRSDTALVLDQKKQLLGHLHLPNLVNDLRRVGNFVRIAYNGVVAADDGCTDLQISIREIGSNVTQLCDKLAIALSIKFKTVSGCILPDLQRTFRILLDGHEGIALVTLAAVADVAKDMASTANELAALQEDFSHKGEEILERTVKYSTLLQAKYEEAESKQKSLEKVFDTESDAQRAQEAREEELKHFEDMRKQIEHCKDDSQLAQVAIDALYQAIGGLKNLLVVMIKAALFWKQMQIHCEILAKDKMKKMIELGMKRPEAQRLRMWTTLAFKKQAIEYYSRWVALDDICAIYMHRIQETQKDLYKYLTENPTTKEARRNVQELAATLAKDFAEEQKAIIKRADEDNQNMIQLKKEIEEHKDDYYTL